jgi:hypothetical protein
MIYGLFRSDALAKTTVHPDLPMPDRFVLTELALHGTYKQIDKYLWYRRHPRSNPSMNDPLTNYQQQIPSQRARLFPQGTKPPWRMYFPVLSHAAGFIYHLGIRPSSDSYANAHFAPYIVFQHLKRRRRFLMREIKGPIHKLRAPAVRALRRCPFLYKMMKRTQLRFVHSVWSDIIEKDDAFWHEALAGRPAAPRVLIATSIGGFQHGSLLESLLAVALTLRGARVDILLCDSFLPACQATEIYNTSIDRLLHQSPQPRCASCETYGKNLFEPLNLPVYWYSKLVTQTQRDEARSLAASIPIGEIGSFRPNDLAVGEHALAGALRYFAAGDLQNELEGEKVLRKYLESSLLTVHAIENLLKDNQYDVACFHHGIYVPQGLIGEVCRARNVRVVNWNPSYRKQTFIFSHGDSYHHTMISEPTNQWEDIPWDPLLEKKTMDYLNSRRYGTHDWIWFHEKPQEDIDRIAETMGIDFAKPWVGMLTNVMWDAQLHYRSNAFKNMLEWVLQTIEYFGKRPDLQLVIRIHPAEVHGMIPSRQLILDEIERHFSKLPENVFIIKPDSDISTYAVCEKCDAVIIYNTKTGIEISSLAIPVIVAGEAWIRNKGFSLDARSREEYFDILDSLPLNDSLTVDELARARKYAFHFFFRRMIEIPYIISPEKYTFALRLSTIEDLSPGRCDGLDVICDGILTGAPFIYHAENEVLRYKECAV